MRARSSHDLSTAVADGNLSNVRLAMRRGADIAKFDITGGNTILARAARDNNPKILQELILRGNTQPLVHEGSTASRSTSTVSVPPQGVHNGVRFFDPIASRSPARIAVWNVQHSSDPDSAKQCLALLLYLDTFLVIF